MSPRVVLLGPPASGKGTQGRRLAASLGLAYLSTGALLREAVEEMTPLGREAKPILDRGGYLPDALMCPILAAWLARQSSGWVLDGFPRSLPQAEFLDGWLASHGQRLDRVIALEAPMDELLRRIRERVECPECRWSGQRAQVDAAGNCPVCHHPVGPRPDDDEANFRRRHAAYETLALPLVGYYEDRGIVSRCDATESPDVVAAGILSFFDSPSESR